MATIQKITPNLWFDTQAEAAVKFYLSVFKKSKQKRITHYGREGFEVHGMPEGTVLTIVFELEGQEFTALNAGPHVKFNEAVSFIVNCRSQAEIDYYWKKLGAGGDKKAQVCGWLKDKFGVSWQVVPVILQEMLSDRDTRKTGRVILEVLKMKKLKIESLKRAFGN
jgi:predicted 3-demethylubiquinone-9 3-methyltransferase (glyoxalase superfamily)